MTRPSLQLSVAGLLLVVACVALNLWLFRISALAGIIGINLTKHVVIAYLCQVLGVDRDASIASGPPSLPAPRPHIPGQ